MHYEATINCALKCYFLNCVIQLNRCSFGLALNIQNIWAGIDSGGDLHAASSVLNLRAKVTSVEK